MPLPDILTLVDFKEKFFYNGVLPSTTTFSLGSVWHQHQRNVTLQSPLCAKLMHLFNPGPSDWFPLSPVHLCHFGVHLHQTRIRMAASSFYLFLYQVNTLCICVPHCEYKMKMYNSQFCSNPTVFWGMKHIIAIKIIAVHLKNYPRQVSVGIWVVKQRWQNALTCDSQLPHVWFQDGLHSGVSSHGNRLFLPSHTELNSVFSVETVRLTAFFICILPSCPWPWPKTFLGPWFFLCLLSHIETARKPFQVSFIWLWFSISLITPASNGLHMSTW